MEDYTDIYKHIFEEIHSAKHIMLVMHQKPDGDTAGSALAMAHYLDTIKKAHTCFCIDELSPTLRFLPGNEKITTDPIHWHPDHVKFDLVIVFDSGDLKYCGIADYVEQLSHEFKIINIDHHATNPLYGDQNLVISTASSTSEIVHDLLHSIDALNKNMANCLLTGVVTDTGGFQNLATTASAIKAAGKLLTHGANLQTITQNTMQNRSVTALKLWGRALERLHTTKDGIVYTIITQKDLEECNANEAAIEGVANFLNSLDEQTDAKAVLVLTERPNGIIKGSLRTTHPLMDVSKIATLLGGGGHKKAAGFQLNGTLVQRGGQWTIQSN